MKSFIDFFTGADGEKSSKRLFMFVLMILFSAEFISNIYWKYEASVRLSDNLFWLIVYFYTGIALEKTMQALGNKLMNKQ